MVARFNVQVKADGKSAQSIERFRARLKKAEQDLLDAPKREVPDILLAGKLHAKRIAPIDTGALVNAIVSSYKNGGKGVGKGVLESRTPNHPRKGKTVAYNVQMHKNPDQYNYRGEPQFMYVTKDYMRRVAEDKAKHIVSVLRDELGRFA